MPALFTFLSSVPVKHVLHWILPLFLTSTVFKAGSQEKKCTEVNTAFFVLHIWNNPLLEMVTWRWLQCHLFQSKQSRSGIDLIRILKVLAQIYIIYHTEYMNISLKSLNRSCISYPIMSRFGKNVTLNIEFLLHYNSKTLVVHMI